MLVASFFFPFKEAAAIGVMARRTAPLLLVSQVLKSDDMGAIAVAAYSYMARVPIIQAIRLVTIRMPYNPRNVSRKTRILFPSS